MTPDDISRMLGGAIHRRFYPPRSVNEYGFDARGAIVQEGSPSGFLLPHEAIADHAESIVKARPPMYVVTGEYVRNDGMRFPELAVSKAYAEWAGYEEEHGRLHRA